MGFLAAGLLFGFFNPNKEFSMQVILFFLACIIIAGIYGGFTAKKSIIYLQALPAFITSILIILTI